MGVVATAAVAIPAYATTHQICTTDGARVCGTWEFGADWNNSVNYSYFFHPKIQHGSSVSNNKYGVVRSFCVKENHLSEASEQLDTNGGNKAFYRACTVN
ncbi:lactococcin 972 family bacteriocin [Streptomyces sp. NPDC048664]|uniref:lactococcin 972 family bacteriocin n=1 Tax=Streptomyces sp. NPDC048664 TaxID=3154505 RepID=UPI003447931C